MHLFKRPKTTSLPIPDDGEDVKQQELSLTAGGEESGTATLEDSMAVSDKTKRTRTIQSNNHALRCLP